MTTRMALVTGADRGVGFGLVKALLNGGWTVFAGRYMPDVPELADLQRSHADTLHLVDLDIGDEASVKAAAAFVAAHTDKLDLIVNNAGILGNIDEKLPDDLGYDLMKQVFDINTLGPLRVTQSFMPLLLNGGLRILANISSEAGSVGNCHRPNWYGYCMSKSALNMQSALVYNQFKQDGLKLLVLHPGWVQSYMHGELNTQARLTADEAAANIMRTIDRADSFEPVNGRPPYIDTHTGNLMAW